MKFLDQVIRKVMGFWGYEVTRCGTKSVLFQNFESLVTAYEQGLNAQEPLISPSATRPQLLARLLGTPPAQAYFIIQALARCRAVPGDVCEFGVAQGETSALIAHEIVPLGDKRLHLFDSFAGLPRPTGKDQLKNDIFSLGVIESYAGTMACPEKMVQNRLEVLAFPRHRYVIHKGFIEELIHKEENLPNAVCFAYLDFDFYEPIRIALEFLHGVTTCGSTIMVDDYDYFSTGVKAAVDEFVAEKNRHGMAYAVVIPDAAYGHFALLTRIDSHAANPPGGR